MTHVTDWILKWVDRFGNLQEITLHFQSYHTLLIDEIDNEWWNRHNESIIFLFSMGLVSEKKDMQMHM